MSQKYIYWKWGNGEGIMQKSLRKNNKNTKKIVNPPRMLFKIISLTKE